MLKRGKPRRKRKLDQQQQSAVTWDRCKIRCNLVLFNNRKWHTGFRLVPKSVTLNGLDSEMLVGASYLCGSSDSCSGLALIEYVSAWDTRFFSKCQKFQPTTHCISHTSSVIVQSCIFSRPRGRGQNSLWCDVSWTLQCTCEQIKRKETEVAESSAQIGYDCERQIDGLSRYCIIYNGTESKTDADIFCVVRYTSSTS